MDKGSHVFSELASLEGGEVARNRELVDRLVAEDVAADWTNRSGSKEHPLRVNGSHSRSVTPSSVKRGNGAVT